MADNFIPTDSKFGMARDVVDRAMNIGRRIGLSGAARAFGRGAGMAVGLEFAGGRPKFIGLRAMGAAGIGAGIGFAAYSMTDNPLVGLGVGAAGGYLATRRLTGGGFGTMMKGAMPLFTLSAMVQGYREGGFGGAISAGAKEAALFGAFEAGIGIIKGQVPSLAGWAAKSPLASFGRFMMNPATLIAGGITLGAVAAGKAAARLGRESMQSEFRGDTSAFVAQGAHTMRMRALQEIQTSHMNARTLLGNEATLLHLV